MLLLARKCLVIFFISLLFQEIAFAQEGRVITGTIVSNDKMPLENVTITVKGGQLATVSDANGKFTLKVAAGKLQLVFSHVGMQTQERSLGASANSIVVVMEAAEGQLADVVVTGYQVLPKERATGSFGVLSKEQIEKPSTNISQRLIGTTAGVQATKVDVDGNPTLQIRGLSTLNASQEPLVVVDGFPIQGSYNSINPNDVESITILKDAAASSIWGARASNGVIVITTKKAAKGVPLKVDFNAFVRVGAKMDLDYIRPLASSAETLDFEEMAFDKWGAQINNGVLAVSGGNQFWAWSEGMNALNEYKLGIITAAERDAIRAKLRTQDNRQQIRDYLLANPVDQQYSLSLSNSTTRMNQVFSVVYEKNQSNFVGTDDRKFMLNYRSTASITKWLELSINGMYQQNKYNNNGSTIDEINSMSPYEMLINEDGSYRPSTIKGNLPVFTRLVPTQLFPYSDWTYNPVQEVRTHELKSTDQNYRIQVGLKLMPIKGLSLESKIQYEDFLNSVHNYYTEESYNVRNAVNTLSAWNPATPTVKPIPNLPKGGFLDQNRRDISSYNWRNMLSFDRLFASKHQVSLVAGSEIQSTVNQYFSQPRTYGYNDATLQLGSFPNGVGGTAANGNQNGTAAPTNLTIRDWTNQSRVLSYTNSFSYGTDRYFSAFGNLAYTYDGKYTLSGSMRSDASNFITDDPSYRYAPFWSAGALWHIWKEGFMQNINWLDRLSLRATYGYNGNVDKSTSFKPLLFQATLPEALTGEYRASFVSLGNPALRWEKTKTVNFGIDYSVFNGKLFGKIDYYRRRSFDLIASIAIPVVNGSTTQKFNSASLNNDGIELELGTAQNFGKNFRWRANANFSYNKNKISSLFLTQYDPYNLALRTSASWVEGLNANTLWMYKYMGFNDQGQPTVLGPNGKNVDIQAFLTGDGRQFLENMGTMVAPYTLGFMNNLDYKDLSFSFIITGNFGHVFQRTGFNYPVQWTTRVMPNKYMSEALSADPTQMLTLPVHENEPRYYFWSRFYNNFSYLAESASWVRLQEVNLTYRLPQNLIKKAGFGRAMLYVQGNDLLVITANKYGEDPLYPLRTLNPRPKYTFGLKCDF